MTDAARHLLEAIEGERRYWHRVEVAPDDIAAVLDDPIETGAEACAGELAEARRQLAELREAVSAREGELRAAVEALPVSYGTQFPTSPLVYRNAVLRLIAAAPVASSGLDVERLRKAIDFVDLGAGEDLDYAAAVAREYALLSEKADR